MRERIAAYVCGARALRAEKRLQLQLSMDVCHFLNQILGNVTTLRNLTSYEGAPSFAEEKKKAVAVERRRASDSRKTLFD